MAKKQTQNSPVAKKQTHLQSTTPTKKKKDQESSEEESSSKDISRSEEESESESESETSKEAKAETLDKKNKKPENEAETFVKKNKKPENEAETLDKKNKKPENEAETSTVKRAKTEIGASSTKMFQRIWSEDDEILLLEGMITYENDKGKNASGNVSFCDFVKDSLSIKNVDQSNTKLKNMKKKYLAKMAKGCDESSFAKSHDRKCFELSKKIWEIDHSVVKFSSRRKTQVEESVDEWFQKSYLVSGLGTVGLLSENAVIEKCEKVPLKTKKMIQERGKQVEEKEVESTNEKTGLLHDVSSIFTQLN